MYLRAVHAEDHIPTLRAFIRANPLGIFTTALDHPTFPFLQSSHIPFLLDVQDEDSETELGVLRGHMARANPQAKALIVTASAKHSDYNDIGAPRRLERDVMILFNGPAHHYVTPTFYVETKPSTGKVVPTWNYAAVECYGTVKVYFDSTSQATDAFLSKQVGDLSQMSETEIMGYEVPWTVGDAPASYLEALKKAIIGIEVEITQMGGKWKMSQEMGTKDREGVVEGFEKLDGEQGKRIAEMVKERGRLVDERKKTTVTRLSV